MKKGDHNKNDTLRNMVQTFMAIAEVHVVMILMEKRTYHVCLALMQLFLWW